MRIAAPIIGIALVAALSPIRAAELTALISDSRGQPVADAVVTLVSQADATVPASAPAPPVTKIIDQKNEAFVPYIEIFRPGDMVVFRNSDQTRHHVYSFAPAKSFEFVLASSERSAPLPLLRDGVVAVGCNIHDHMIAYLYVSSAPWVARSGADGRMRIGELPAGAYTVHVWHPQLRPGRSGPTQQSIAIAADEVKQLTFALALLPDPRLQLDRERSAY